MHRTLAEAVALFEVGLRSCPRLSSAAGCSTVARADKGKPTERWGRKASGLRTQVYDGGVASDTERAYSGAGTWRRAVVEPAPRHLHVGLPRSSLLPASCDRIYERPYLS